MLDVDSTVGLAGLLLRAILPHELVSEIEWSTLKVEPGTFIDVALTSQFTDLLFSAAAEGELALLYLIVEHQSTVDSMMAFRLLHYLTRLWARWLRAHPTAKRLPRVVPIVIYAGEKPWDAATAVEDLVDGPMTSWTPRMTFLLEDLSGVSDDALGQRGLGLAGQITLRCLLRLPRSSDPIGELRRLSHLLRQLLAGPHGLQRFVTVLEYLSRVANVALSDVRTLVRDVSPRDEETTMTTLAERMGQEARHQTAVEITLRQLRLKFAREQPLPEAVVARVEAGTEAELERWSEPFVFATTLDQVFDDSPLT